MKNPNPEIRKAVFDALNVGGGIVYSGTQKICTFEEYLQETTTKKRALLVAGNQEQTEAYIILLNQTLNEGIGNKCGRNDECSIQIQITTVWPAGKGGSIIAERIGDLAMQRLETIQLPEPFGLWRSTIEAVSNINYNSNDTRTWIVQYTLSYSVTQ